jgi:phosphoglycolate phosphatase
VSRVARAVLFDLDGTLVDTAPAIARAVNRSLNDRGMDAQPEEVVRGWIGGGMETLLRRTLQAFALPEDDRTALAELVAGFRVHYRSCLAEGAEPYPGMRELLHELRADGCRLALVTNKPREFAVPLLRALDLDGFFGILLCGDDLPTQKPDPLPLLTALRALAVEPAGSWMIGDSIADVLAAERAGVSSVLMAHGYGSSDPQALAGATWHAADVAQLRALLYPR